MDKKPLFDSDIDPKRIKNVADGLRRQGEFESARMLDSYADLLEAREKAVPVYQHRSKNSPMLRWFECSEETFMAMEHNEHDKEHFDRRILYTHPAPSDAERLAEALRACALNWQEIAAATWRSYSVSASNVDKASAIAHMHCAQDIRKALAAHCAQAQPPAARVPGVSAQAHEKAQAALAAQENPNG